MELREPLSYSDLIAKSFPEGRLTDASGDAQMEVINPSTAELITKVAVASSDDIDQAVEAGTAAQVMWSARSMADRVSVLDGLVEQLYTRREELARLDSIDSGNPIQACRNDVDDIVRNYEHWAALARTMRLSRYGWDGRDLHFDAPMPYGVVLRIAAYNKPLYFAVCGALMPLLAGNSVLLKPAPQSPLSALAFGRIAAAVLPSGLLSVLPGDGRTGATMVRHPGIRRIAFTGSVSTGLAIQRVCADSSQVKHLTLELGGKNAMVILEDADLESASSAVVAGASLLTTQGQSCQALSRILAHERIQEELLERVIDRLANIRLGLAYSDQTDMGPVISGEHRDRIQGAVAEAVDGGARVRFNEKDIEVPTSGFFQAPVLLDSVDPSMVAAQEEIFGPVLCSMTFRNLNEAVSMANDVRFGLTASVWTQDVERVLSVASRLEAGYIWVNDVSRHYEGTPFGGVKDSGVGREESEGALRSFVQERVVHIKSHETGW